MIFNNALLYHLVQAPSAFFCEVQRFEAADFWVCKV